MPRTAFHFVVGGHLGSVASHLEQSVFVWQIGLYRNEGCLIKHVVVENLNVAVFVEADVLFAGNAEVRVPFTLFVA